MEGARERHRWAIAPQAACTDDVHAAELKGKVAVNAYQEALAAKQAEAAPKHGDDTGSSLNSTSDAMP